MDVGKHTTSSNSDTSQQLAQLFVIANCQLDVTGHNTSLLVVTGSVACQLKDLSSKVLQHCCLQQVGNTGQHISHNLLQQTTEVSVGAQSGVFSLFNPSKSGVYNRNLKVDITNLPSKLGPQLQYEWQTCPS